MAKKYMQDPEERERNNLIRQKLAAEQKKVNDEAKRQLQEQKEQQEVEEIEEEIDLTPAEPLFATLLRKKGWYDIVNQDGIIVDEDGLILPKGEELKARRLHAAEAIVKCLNNKA